MAGKIVKLKISSLTEFDRILLVYNNKKRLLGLIGVIAAIAALFLQIPIVNDSLKHVQALIIVILISLITYLILTFWHEIFIRYRKETSISIASSTIFSGVAIIFLINLYNFAWQIFKQELLDYFTYAKFGIAFLTIFSLEKLASYLVKKIGHRVLIGILVEVIWILLIMFFLQNMNALFVSTKISLNLKLSMIIFFIFMFINNILLSVFKIYSKRTYFTIIVIILLVYSLYLFNPTKLLPGINKNNDSFIKISTPVVVKK